MFNGVLVAGYEVREEFVVDVELMPVEVHSDADEESSWLLGAEAWVPTAWPAAVASGATR